MQHKIRSHAGIYSPAGAVTKRGTLVVWARGTNFHWQCDAEAARINRGIVSLPHSSHTGSFDVFIRLGVFILLDKHASGHAYFVPCTR